MSQTLLDRPRALEVAQPRASETPTPAATPAERRKRIVIVGAGFAGVAAARALRHCDAEVVLIDRRNHHIFQPLLYQVATAVARAVRYRRPDPATRRKAEKPERDARRSDRSGPGFPFGRGVEAPGAGILKIPFDYLVIAAGMRPSYFGHDEFARYAPGLKSLGDAESIRANILSAYEAADATDDENERARQLTFVLVGAGPTGVELAASMAHMAKVTLRGQFRRIDPAKSSIILIEGGKRILPSFAEKLANKAARQLEKLGVKILTGVKVENVDANGVLADGKAIPSATVLWTAGVATSPIVKLLGAKTDRAGRVAVGPFMNVENVPGVFVVGDASSVVSRWTSGARRRAGGDPAGPLCRTADRAAAQGTRTETSVSVLRQGQHGRGRPEFRDPGERAPAHQRVSHLAGLGGPARHGASAAAEPAAGADPVALVVCHRAAQLAIDPGAAPGLNPDPGR